jgi:hypothetical protein
LCLSANAAQGLVHLDAMGAEDQNLAGHPVQGMVGR